jgi:hypothetical protein
MARFFYLLLEQYRPFSDHTVSKSSPGVRHVAGIIIKWTRKTIVIQLQIYAGESRRFWAKSLVNIYVLYTNYYYIYLNKSARRNVTLSHSFLLKK